jgi:hypothetical protein
MVEIIGVGDRTHNNPSEVDGIGTRMLRIPSFVFRKLMKMPAFDWIMENNENVSIFMKLNPQFDYAVRESGKKVPIPSSIVNKDGTLWDIFSGRPFLKQK